MTKTVLNEPQTTTKVHTAASWPDRVAQMAISHKSAFEQSSRQFSNLEMARERAAFTKWKAIENLDTYLIEFESNFIKSGGKVIWAQDISDALMAVLEILEKSGNKKVLKSKSQTSEEIGLSNRLTQEGYQTVETDAGDFIIQQAGENSSHMVLPALHKSSDEIAQLFHQKFGLAPDADADTIVSHISQHLRAEFRNAGTGITGANFLIADPGAVVILENEGNAQLTAALPKTHIVIAGIEKILPSLADLDLFLPLLSSYGTGQLMTSYTSIITGPKQADEADGPEELYVILLDNGRSNVLGQEVQRQAMTCIKCGACQYVCPVYRSAGSADFPSPVAAVTIPLQRDMEVNQNYTYASTLCGACKDVCPVKIDLPRLLLENRKLFVEQGYNPRGEKWFYYLWKKAMLKRDIMNWKGIRAGKHIMENLYKSKDGARKMPPVATKSFNEQWREKRNVK